MAKNKIIIVFFITVLLGLGYGLFLFFVPVKNIAEQKTDLKTTDKEILEDFNVDPVKADAKYQKKIIELTGTVKKTEINDSICSIIMDKGGNFIIIASCLQTAKQNIEKLKDGNLVVVKGIYNGYVINDDTYFIPAELKIDKCTLTK